MTASFRALLVCLFSTFHVGAVDVNRNGPREDSVCKDIAMVQVNARLNSTQSEIVEYKKSGVAEATTPGIDYSAVAAEFIAMDLFVIIGCGSAMGIAKEPGSAWVLQVSLSFGLAITALACTIGKISGGHINCAVTLGLVIAGKVSMLQGVANFCAQMLGSVAGAAILLAMYPKGMDKTGGLGSNGVQKGWTWVNALVGEIAMTFLLMFVVLETTSHNHGTDLATIAIGFAVFLAHSVLIPIDGCSINPTRSFGPALIARLFYTDANTFSDMWIFWVGPLVGASLAAGFFQIL